MVTGANEDGGVFAAGLANAIKAPEKLGRATCFLRDTAGGVFHARTIVTDVGELGRAAQRFAVGCTQTASAITAVREAVWTGDQGGVVLRRTFVDGSYTGTVPAPHRGLIATVAQSRAAKPRLGSAA